MFAVANECAAAVTSSPMQEALIAAAVSIALCIVHLHANADAASAMRLPAALDHPALKILVPRADVSTYDATWHVWSGTDIAMLKD